jgi:hypothetical protein
MLSGANAVESFSHTEQDFAGAEARVTAVNKSPSLNTAKSATELTKRNTPETLPHNRKQAPANGWAARRSVTPKPIETYCYFFPD